MKIRQTIPPTSASAKGVPRAAKIETSTGKTFTNGDARAAGPTRISPAERRKLIEKAAYSRAQGRNFASGSELQDWLEAEAEVDRLLRSS